MTTVFNSIFWAMCFFTAIVALWGPEDNAGDLRKYFACCQCRQSEKEVAEGMSAEEKDVELATDTTPEHEK